jgi:exodeoxyribonuclease-3
MKIATYNVNGVRSRLQNLLAWLERERPDVACLQELKCPDEAFPQAALREAGYEAIWHGQKSWNGVAILARDVLPEETRRGLPGDPDDTHSRYIEAKVHGVRIGCLYLPNGNPQPGPKFDYKLKWFERFNRHAARLWKTGDAIVLCGDYNVVPTDFDIYKPDSWRNDALLQPESRAAYASLLKQGWTDAIRARFPNDKVFTFWDYFRQHWQRNAGLRIDHLLLSSTLPPKLLDAGVHTWVRAEPGASDHAPAWIELDIAAARKSPRKAVAASAAKAVAQASVAKAVRKVANAPAKKPAPKS